VFEPENAGYFAGGLNHNERWDGALHRPSVVVFIAVDDAD
jgi:hypothetical protein